MAKKIDFSKTIGMIKRGGMFSPSNERSEAKAREVLDRCGYEKNHPLNFDAKDVVMFREHAKLMGFKLYVHERGLNR